MKLDGFMRLRIVFAGLVFLLGVGVWLISVQNAHSPEYFKERIETTENCLKPSALGYWEKIISKPDEFEIKLLEADRRNIIRQNYPHLLQKLSEYQEEFDLARQQSEYVTVESTDGLEFDFPSEMPQELMKLALQGFYRNFNYVDGDRDYAEDQKRAIARARARAAVSKTIQSKEVGSVSRWLSDTECAGASTEKIKDLRSAFSKNQQQRYFGWLWALIPVLAFWFITYLAGWIYRGFRTNL